MCGATPCGDIMPSYCQGVRDTGGCMLPRGHKGEHLSYTDQGMFEWETDLDCGCEHCMQCEGDYCVAYDSVQPVTAAEVSKLNLAELKLEQWPPPAPTGMHVGMTRGVRMVHLPTGITVVCDHDRSQHRNRDEALIAVATALNSLLRQKEMG